MLFNIKQYIRNIILVRCMELYNRILYLLSSMIPHICPKHITDVGVRCKVCIDHHF